MSAPSAKLMVSVSDTVVVVKITGRASFTSSLDFKALIEALRRRGHRHFALELSECVIMDSTFLGVLAGLGVKSAEAAREGRKCPIALVNPNSRITDLLANLGVSHLFQVIHRAPADDTQFREPDSPAPKPSRAEVSRTCLEAHELLMAMNPANIPKFKDVTQFLAEDLKRMERGR
jgi:anti-anti-sigma regulatory factor